MKKITDELFGACAVVITGPVYEGNNIVVQRTVKVIKNSENRRYLRKLRKRRLKNRI